MNEVVKVSISGIGFTFEQDAYQVMRDYLDRLEAGYRKNPDGKEIIADIEARIAELILSHQSSDMAVAKPLADEIVGQLGFPDDMDSSTEPPTAHIAKRLYRNPDGAKLGGVCSGLGVYFDIDPVWLRIFIFIPMLLVPVFGIFDHHTNLTGFFAMLFGVLFMLYFILWLCIPMARTARQKLEMKGEKITAQSIHDNFSQDAAAAGNSPQQQRNASVWANLMSVIGRIFLFCIKAFLFIIALAVGSGAIGLLIALISGLLGGTVFVSMFGIDNLFTDLPGAPVAYAILVIVALILFFVLVGYLLCKVIFEFPLNKRFLAITSGVWLFILIFVGVMTFRYIFFFEDKDHDYFDRLGDRIEKTVEGAVDDFDKAYSAEFQHAVDLTVDSKSDDKLLRSLRNGEDFTIEGDNGGTHRTYTWSHEQDNMVKFDVIKQDSIGKSNHSFSVKSSLMRRLVREAIRHSGDKTIILFGNDNSIEGFYDDEENDDEQADSTTDNDSESGAKQADLDEMIEQGKGKGMDVKVEPLDTIYL